MARLVTATLLALAALAILSTAHAQPLSLDSGFGTDGILSTETTLNLTGSDLAIDTKDRGILVSTVGVPPSERLFLYRSNPDGSLDAEYTTRIPVPGIRPTARIAINGVDKATVVGSFKTESPGSERQPYLARVLEDGTPDPSLGSDGIAAVNVGFSSDIRGLDLLGDRAIVGLYQLTSGPCFVASIRPDASLDPSFGQSGLLELDTGSERCISEDVVVGEDRIYVLGRVGPSLDESAVVWAVTLDGELDASFGTGGHVRFEDPTTSRLRATTLELWDGRVVVAGTWDSGSSEGVFALRLLTDGGFDSNFNGDGVLFQNVDASVASEGNNARIGAAVQRGQLVLTLSGRVGNERYVLLGGALTEAGQFIPQSGRNGFFERSITIRAGSRVFPFVHANAAADGDGRILVGGSRELSGGGESQGLFARLLVAPPPALTLDFKLLSGNEIPNEGGAVRVRAKVTNEGDSPASPDLWAIATFPGGTNTSTVIRPRPRAIDAGRSYAKRYRIRVPKNAPAGEYTLTYFVGSFPDEIAASETLTLVKLPPSAGASAPTGTDWQLTFEEDIAPGPLVLAPNPTRGDTWLTLDAPAVVTVRDALGREVLRQTAEAGRLGIPTEALAPGVYSIVMENASGWQTARLTVVR
ncbi:MAG: T9SS type A sorting domain-containing protein [Bacteroidota bacterium]